MNDTHENTRKKNENKKRLQTEEEKNGGNTEREKNEKKANKPNTKQMKTQDTFELPEVDIFMTFSDISLEIV